MSSSITPAVDVFIAGGGPAGLACAIALARKGHRVLVADGMKPPIDKACGEGLMSDSVAALHSLGIDFRNSLTETAAQIRGIRFIDTADATAAQAFFPRVPGGAYGIRRKVLHELLLRQATELGVVFLWETAVRGFVERKTGQGADATIVETSRGHVTARFVVGADGHHSRIRQAAGLDRATMTAQRVGLRQHFAMAPWTDFVEVYWSGHGQAYVTPISAHEVCVAFVNSARFVGGVAEALTHFPQLADRLAGATQSGLPRGAITYSRKLHRVTRGSVALVGDASGSVDAVTGEGLSLAFRQALSLADAVHSRNLPAYQRSHRRMQYMPHLMARIMLLLDRSPFLRSHSIALLAALPGLFKLLLSIHIGHADGPPATGSVAGGPALDANLPGAISSVIPHNAVP